MIRMVIEEKIIHMWVFFQINKYIGVFIILYIMKLLHSQVQPPSHVIPHSNAFAFLYFLVSFSHLTIPV